MFTTTNYLRPLVLLMLAALAASVMMAVVLAKPVQAASLTVSTAADEPQNTNEKCSLREAIVNANANFQLGSADCTAGNGADTIGFAPSLSGQTITLGGPLDPITDPSGLTIDAESANITISGGNVVGAPVFYVDGFAELTLKNLTVANGDFTLGGGVFNGSGGTLTVNKSTISGNRASAFGGGIYNERGLLEVNNSTISGNSASEGGGGIANLGGTVEVNNSTLSGNSATSLLTGNGGGIFSDGGGTLTVNNSTLSGNSTSGGPGGGIFSFSSGTLRNTIVANSTVADGTAPRPNCLGSPLTDGGGNLDDDGTCGFFDSSSLSNTPDGLDPDGLKNNGGPTQTIALQGDSAAIDAAVGCPAPSIDQRGVLRPQDGDANGTAACDIGAFELEEPTNSSNNPPSVAVSDGACLSDTKALGRLDFTVSDEDGDDLAFSATSDNTALIPNSKLQTRGSGANRTLTLTGVPTQSGTATVTVLVDDHNGGVSELAVEVWVGTQNPDTITGTEGVDVIFGLAGQGTLNGGGGNDLVCGGNDNDTISGGTGNDVLDGGRGDDVLNGGDGNDKLLGNAGRDTLTGEGGADSFSGGSGTDTATDFKAGEDSSTGIP